MAPGILYDQLFHDDYKTEYPEKTDVLRGWPNKMKGDTVWSGSDYQGPSAYTLTLSPQHKEEIQSALDHFYELGLNGDEVTQENFPLPSLSEKLLQCSEQVHCGRGFVNIRGLQATDFSTEDNAVIFLGISSYIGEKRGKQDEDGNMMMHIHDIKETRTPQAVRPIRYSSTASAYHTDTFCDILALHTRSNAATGGKHALASSWTVYNEIQRLDPGVLSTLAQPNWHFDSRSKLMESNCRPLLFYLDDRIILNFAPEPLKGVKGVSRAEGLPELSPSQLAALNMVQTCAKNCELVLDLQPGDMTFINNHAILHSRDAFRDSAEQQRHIVRLWLQNQSLAWRLPEQLKQGNRRIYDQNEIMESWNIAPTPRLVFSLSERLCS